MNVVASQGASPKTVFFEAWTLLITNELKI